MTAGESSLFDSLLASPELAELKRIELRSRRSISTDLVGKYRSAFRGSGLVFSELREYEPGDEIKNISWKATARTGRPMVKSYHEERLLNILLAVDISNSTLFGQDKSKHRRALEFAALLAALGQRNQDAVGLCLFSDNVEEFIPPSAKRSQLYQVLSCLSKARKLRRATNIGKALEYIAQQQRKPCIIFLVSDFLAPDFSTELRSLSLRHDFIAVLLQDRLDSVLPSAGIVEFSDAESADRVLIDTGNQQTLQSLEILQAERIEQLRSMLNSCRADLICITDNILAPLAELMSKRTARQR